MHIAATLKKLLTILLLIILATQASAYFHAQTHEMSFIQEADEKKEKNGEEKNEKEYLSSPTISKIESYITRSFGSFSCTPGLSPALDHLTPPPDVT